MKTKCKNPNGLQNLQAIASSHFIKNVKFNSLDKAKLYLKSEGYRYRQAFSFKEDRSMIYQGRNGWVKLSSSKDYLNKDTMEQGTVWNIVKI
jgi:hypothetical protein